MIKVAILTFSAGWMWVFVDHAEFEDNQPQKAVDYINLHARNWCERGRQIAAECGGVFELDNITKQWEPGEIPQIENLQYGADFSANGEEFFVAALDEKSQARFCGGASL